MKHEKHQNAEASEVERIVILWWLLRAVFILPALPLVFLGWIGDKWLEFTDKSLPRARVKKLK